MVNGCKRKDDYTCVCLQVYLHMLHILMRARACAWEYESARVCVRVCVLRGDACDYLAD